MKIKVLHIITNLQTGGAERISLDIVKQLSQHKNIDVNISF